MKIKLTTLMKTKFNISNPHQVLKELKQIGKIDSRSLRKLFEDTSPEKFNFEIVKKYVLYISTHPNKSKIAYEPKYWMYRRNISYEDAVEIINQNKIDNGQTKEAFIKRYGKEKGEDLFAKFQKNSSYPTSNEYFMEKYGDRWEEERNYAMRKKTKRCVEYWTCRGYSLEDAKLKVSEFQQSTSGVHRNYYRNLGYSETEIDIIFKQINNKKKNNIRNTNYLKEKYPDNWKEVYLEVSEKYRKKMEELGLWICKDLVDDFKKYKDLVIRYTNQSILFYKELIENIELRSMDYHLDHKYSIKMGFINDIDPKIIGSVVNIEIIPAKINASKQEKCSITKPQLLKNYKKFTEKYENQKD